jgi:hypothetical protein
MQVVHREGIGRRDSRGVHERVHHGELSWVIELESRLAAARHVDGKQPHPG